MIWKIDTGNFLLQFLRLEFHGTYVNCKINYHQIFLDKKFEIIRTTYDEYFLSQFDACLSDYRKSYVNCSFYLQVLYQLISLSIRK